jgi:hypothetical protein
MLKNSLGPPALSATIVITSLLSFLAYWTAGRVGVQLEVWCYLMVGVGPFGCLFLTGMLLVAFFRAGKRNYLALGLGVAFGLGTFAAFWYEASRTSPDGSPGANKRSSGDARKVFSGFAFICVNLR